MNKKQLKLLIASITLQIKIIQTQLAILLLKKKQILYIIVHHTATDRDTTKYEAINRNHKIIGYPMSAMGQYCGYQYFINGKGKITQARLDTEEGMHTRRHNSNTIGICISGSFGHEIPSEGQLKALEGLLNEKLREYGLDKSRIKGHKDFRPTACPGASLYRWVQDFKGRL